MFDVDELGSGAVALGAHKDDFALCFLYLADQAHLLLLLRVKLLDFLQLRVDPCFDHFDKTRDCARELRIDANDLCLFLAILSEGEKEAVAQVVCEVVGVFELRESAKGDLSSCFCFCADVVDEAAVFGVEEKDAPNLDHFQSQSQQLSLLGRRSLLLSLHPIIISHPITRIHSRMMLWVCS